jgi:hypothetical protein
MVWAAVLAHMTTSSSTSEFRPVTKSGANPISTSASTGGFGFEKPGKGNTHDWLTPLAIPQRLGPFDLDACGCAGMPWRIATTTYFLPDHDGLLEPWHGRVWCNPPYGHGVEEPWLKRMEQHGNGMLLIFARTETLAWQKSVFPYADALLFVEGRVRFRFPNGEIGKSGTAPSVLLAYGQNNVEALRNAGIAGALYRKAEMLVGAKASQF